MNKNFLKKKKIKILIIIITVIIIIMKHMLEKELILMK